VKPDRPQRNRKPASAVRPGGRASPETAEPMSLADLLRGYDKKKIARLSAGFLQMPARGRESF